jgi:hypothetical protein
MNKIVKKIIFPNFIFFKGLVMASDKSPIKGATVEIYFNDKASSNVMIIFDCASFFFFF